MNESAMAARLLEADRFAILTHRRPDGDTVGSAAALCRGLRQRGKAAWVVENPQITPKYTPFLAGLTCPAIPEGATVVAVDVAAEDMLPGAPTQSVALAIDHHGTHSGFAAASLVRPERAACAEIVYDVLLALDVTLTPDIADALYLGVSTDTGCFRHGNVTENTFRVAAALLRAGADCARLNHRLFVVKSRARLLLEAHLTRSMALCAGGAVGICAIPATLRDELGLTEDDVDDVSGFARAVEGVELAAMLREQPSGRVKLSLRSSARYDVARICAALGGGGHHSAAGATVDGPIEAAARTLRAAIHACYPELEC